MFALGWSVAVSAAGRDVIGPGAGNALGVAGQHLWRAGWWRSYLYVLRIHVCWLGGWNLIHVCWISHLKR